MKLKEKFQRFWTLSKSREGFTLVELIVVIAILAILAGVAIPVYNGYIKKAQTAADQTLLDSVNTSFAAACAENGLSQYDITDAKIKIEADGTIGVASGETTSYVQKALTETSNVTADINEAFAFYYAGNENAAFNTFTYLAYDNEKGIFVDGGDGVTVSLPGGGTMTFSPEQIELFQSSTYANIGGESLLGEIASLTSLVGGEDFDSEQLLGNTQYMQSFASYLGVENASDLEGEELSDAINAAATEMGGMSEDAMLNGLVYWAAENSSTMNTTDVTALLTSGNVYGNLSSDMGTKLAQASMVYGMYTAYVNSDYYKGESDDIETNPMNVVKAVGSDTDFATYVSSAQGQADMEAYIAAMGVINDSTSNGTMTAEVLNGGFDNEELANLLAQVLGK